MSVSRPRHLICSDNARSARTRGALAVAVLSALLLAPPGRAGAQDPLDAQSGAEEQESPTTDATTRPASTLPTTGPAPARNGAGGQPGGVERQNGGLVLNFRDASIDVVLDELSEAAGLIIVREAKPTGRVTLTSRQPVSPADAVQLLNTVLHNNGYAAIQQGRVLKIVESARAKKLNIPVRSGRDPKEIEPTDELITQVIPLRHADAMQLRDDLAPVVNPEADFTANASSNALVITDTAANVRRIVEIIDALDTTLADSVEVKVFQLEYANAVNTATLINNVFGNLEFGSGGGGEGGNPQEMFMRMMAQRGGGGGRGGNQQQQGGAARGSRINAAADDRTNSLVVTGPGDTLEIVSTVVAQLDENPAANEAVFVYRLRNAQAVNVEGVVNSLFGNAIGSVGRGGVNQQQNGLQSLQRSRTGGGGSGSRLGGGSGGGGLGGGGNQQNNRQAQLQQIQQQQLQQQLQQQQQNRQGGGGGQGRLSRNAQQSAQDLAGQVTIIADADSNSLLVRTAPQNIDRVRSILEELDRPVAQVLIKVLIAEVTHDDSLDVGTQFSVLNLRASGLGQEGGTNFNIPVEGAAATGLVVQVLEQDFSAAVRALETNGKLDVLSRPYILASDNQLASITVGQEVPFVTRSTLSDTGQINNTIEYADVGILLDVIPHINPDGMVILDVAPEISTLTGTTVPISDQVNAPLIAKRSALSRVGVRNGQTIVIGGLMEDRKVQTVNKVPILGDIPIVGNAFKRTQSTKVKTELLIFLTPHVASDPDMLERMRQDELDGTTLTPNAVGRGEFDRHMEGLQRGATVLPSATQPAMRSLEPPSTQPAAGEVGEDRRDPGRDQRPASPPPEDRRRAGGAGGGRPGAGQE